jgi:hypothetical protein
MRRSLERLVGHHGQQRNNMEDYYNDGFNAGRGQSWRNEGHGSPQSDGDRYSYRTGQEDGERRREISRELDREGE